MDRPWTYRKAAAALAAVLTLTALVPSLSYAESDDLAIEGDALGLPSTQEAAAQIDQEASADLDVSLNPDAIEPLGLEPLAAEDAVAPITNARGRAIPSALMQVRELETESDQVEWSFGIGTQYFLENDVYPQISFQRALGSHASFGVIAAGMGGFGTGQAFQLTQYLGSFNLHSQRNFRGMWLQVGGGVTVIKSAPPSPGSSGDVWSRPTGIASLGWRWGIPDTVGRDDAFSISLSAGAEAFFGTTPIASFSTSSVKLLPVIKAEVNFGF